MFDFRRITLLCLDERLSKHKMTICSKTFWGNGPSAPPGYGYANKAPLPSLNPKHSEISLIMETSFIICVKCWSQRSEESFFNLK